MTDFFATPAASFDEPVELLMACHERVRHYASLSCKLAEHLRQHGVDDQARAAAAAILRYFDVAAPLHHQDEDDDLFPLLSSRADEALQHRIAAITAEHAELGGLWQQVRVLLAKLAQGEAADLPQSLVETFAQRYCAHAQSEDDAVYPWAGRLLSPAELQELGRRMAARRGLVSGDDGV